MKKQIILTMIAIDLVVLFLVIVGYTPWIAGVFNFLSLVIFLNFAGKRKWII